MTKHYTIGNLKDQQFTCPFCKETYTTDDRIALQEHVQYRHNPTAALTISNDFGGPGEETMTMVHLMVDGPTRTNNNVDSGVELFSEHLRSLIRNFEKHNGEDMSVVGEAKFLDGEITLNFRGKKAGESHE